MSGCNGFSLAIIHHRSVVSNSEYQLTLRLLFECSCLLNDGNISGE